MDLVGASWKSRPAWRQGSQQTTAAPPQTPTELRSFACPHVPARPISASSPPDGRGEVVAPGHQRASVVTDTQAQAIGAGRPIVANSGGAGERRIKGRDGRLRDSDTVAPGHESPRHDTK